MESVRLRPSSPDELARPRPSCPELSSSRVVSPVPAASTTARAVTRWRRPVLRSTYSTPAARAPDPISTRDTIASVTTRSLPVALAIGSSDVVVWNIAPMVQPRVQGVALKQALRGATGSGMSRVRTAVCAARTGMPRLSAAAVISISGTRGLGGDIRQSAGESGWFSSPIGPPLTPIIRSTRS